jgi:2-keto-4-pentenoate hydratase/2-oxohepta-3-ene-1,7-dioic acid hydratase in catechol pathway
LSKHFTLEQGDLILTGTPEGVVFGMKEKCRLKAGDVVKAYVEGLGFTKNKVQLFENIEKIVFQSPFRIF